jgi:hypothetical protein
MRRLAILFAFLALLVGCGSDGGGGGGSPQDGTTTSEDSGYGY